MKLDTLLAWFADRRRWRRWLLDLLLLLAVVIGVGLWQTRELPQGPAPLLAGPDLAGSPLALTERLAAGRPALVVFWARWCGVCRAELGTLAALATDHPVIAVAMRSGDARQIAAFLSERGLSLPVLVDATGDLADAWHVRGVPAHFIIDPSGLIRARSVGYTTGWGLRLRLWWAGLTA